MTPHDNQPLTSATYIPGNDTLGVGIPPLFDLGGQTYDPYAQQRQASSQTYHPGTDGPLNPQTPGTRLTPPFALHNHVHELVTNDNPSQGPSVGDFAKSPTHRHQASGASLGGMSPSEAAIQWPLDRVLLWLARNGFSKDWQETFRSLELQGADFLELGLASGGRGNLGKMHKVVYPQLAKECARSGTGWDSTREREEGLRMRKLIRQIHDNESDSSISTPLRGDPPGWATATVEHGTGFYSSPPLNEPRSAGPTGGVNDITPEQLANVQSAAVSQQKVPQMRSVTLPIPSGFEAPTYESPSRESPSWLRSDYSRNALAAVNDHRRQSPSVSSENGAIPSSLRAQESPKSGSPAAQYASPYSGLTSSSTGDLSLKYEHSRVNSTESTPGVGRGSSSTGRYYESRRQGNDATRPSAQAQESSKAHGTEPSSSNPREHGKSILNIFSRKKGHKLDALSHPSSEDLESPPSPEARSNGYLPYQSAFNSSDMSLGERSSSATPAKTKKWMFATMDGYNYRLIDITDWDSVETLRVGICQSLGIADWGGAQMFLTQPGQTEHEDPMSDSILAVSRRTKSDAYGSLKIFVKGVAAPNSANQAPRFDGLGVSIPSEKPAQSPTATQGPIHRKPLEEGALNRISPKTQAKPYSDLLGSRQNTLKASISKPSQDTSPDPGLNQDPDKMDLLARHEAHMREVERKQKENRISRMPPSTAQQTRKDTYGDTGYRREGVIDFDSPRLSPYEEKKVEKSDTLVPLRKPPVAPNESNTLTKVNSLRKAPGEWGDRHRHQTQAAGQAPGLGAVLATVGRMSSAIGTPSPSVPSVHSQDSMGSDSDRTSTMGSSATASSRTTLGKLEFRSVLMNLRRRVFQASSNLTFSLRLRQECKCLRQPLYPRHSSAICVPLSVCYALSPGHSFAEAYCAVSQVVWPGI